MFRQVRALAVLAGVSVLAACGSGQPFYPPGSGVAPPAQRVSSPSSITPDKGCGGVHGVKVTPCPIRLSRHTKSGIVVTVSGPRVVSSALGTIQSCYSGYNCYNVARYGSSQTQWLITSGSYCGGAILEFEGENARGRHVGYAFLEIANKYCP
jgi:predicted small lipoprotein YifL